MSVSRQEAMQAFLDLRNRASERALRYSFYTPDDRRTADQADLDVLRQYIEALEAKLGSR